MLLSQKINVIIRVDFFLVFSLIQGGVCHEIILISIELLMDLLEILEYYELRLLLYVSMKYMFVIIKLIRITTIHTISVGEYLTYTKPGEILKYISVL